MIKRINDMKRKCIFCGDELEPQGDGKWICPFCGQDYTQDDFDYQDYIKERI